MIHEGDADKYWWRLWPHFLDFLDHDNGILWKDYSQVLKTKTHGLACHEFPCGEKNLEKLEFHYIACGNIPFFIWSSLALK